MKECSSCDTIKPLSAFYKRRASKDGLCASCKDCCNKAIREAYSRRIRAYKKQYYAQNREKLLTRQKAYHFKNRERILDYQREYRGLA